MDPEQETLPLLSVSADIRHWDLIFFNLHMLPRIRGNWLLVAALVLFFLFFEYDQSDIPHLIRGIVSAVIAATVSFATAFAFCITAMLVNASNNSGQLGPHVFTLRRDGFHEQTSGDESFKRWQGIHSVIASKHGPYIRITWYLCHVIAASAFASRADFDRFSRLALEL